MKETIKLFKAVEIKHKRKKNPSKQLLERTIKRGFIFSQVVIANYSETKLLDLISVIEKEIGLTTEQMNSSFHKSWNKVKRASIEQLVIEQLIHYITTYGFEQLGIYNEESIYIPPEKLNLPELKKGINLVVINGYTQPELKEKLLVLLETGIALKDDTIQDIIELCTYLKVDEKDIEGINNKEVKIILYSKLNIVPSNPTEFFRYIIFLKTTKSLLIKNDSLINQIKESVVNVNELFVKYNEKNGYDKLAKIFNRFKPLFLAMKTNLQMKYIINRISKLSKKHHVPMPEDYLNTITDKIKNDVVDTKKLVKELGKVNVFRKIRLAYALKFRTKEVDSIMYKIRNGKSFATEYQFFEQNKAKNILNIVLDSIITDLSKNVKGKKIFLPNNIVYSLPATEKQFTGNLPSGSYIKVPKNIVFGVHWKNVDNNRIDLDLSLMNEDGKIGWDGRYRSDDNNILFSGDMTDGSSNGASELFFIGTQKTKNYIMFVNYFNYDEKIDVPFKIVVGEEQVKNLTKNYMINPNNVICMEKTTINQKQKILGLIEVTTNGCKFFFSESYLGSSITASNNVFINNAKKYLLDFYKNTISLNDLLIKAGGILVTDKEEAEIDLSINKLEKDTIINLIKK